MAVQAAGQGTDHVEQLVDELSLRERAPSFRSAALLAAGCIAVVISVWGVLEGVAGPPDHDACWNDAPAGQPQALSTWRWPAFAITASFLALTLVCLLRLSAERNERRTGRRVPGVASVALAVAWGLAAVPLVLATAETAGDDNFGPGFWMFLLGLPAAVLVPGSLLALLGFFLAGSGPLDRWRGWVENLTVTLAWSIAGCGVCLHYGAVLLAGSDFVIAC